MTDYQVSQDVKMFEQGVISWFETMVGGAIIKSLQYYLNRDAFDRINDEKKVK